MSRTTKTFILSYFITCFHFLWPVEYWWAEGTHMSITIILAVIISTELGSISAAWSLHPRYAGHCSWGFLESNLHFPRSKQYYRLAVQENLLCFSFLLLTTPCLSEWLSAPELNFRQQNPASTNCQKRPDTFLTSAQFYILCTVYELYFRIHLKVLRFCGHATWVSF